MNIIVCIPLDEGIIHWHASGLFLHLFVPFNLDEVDYVQASLYLAPQDCAAARNLLEPVSACSNHVDEFSTEVNLALLYVYSKTTDHEKAKEIYSRIMGQKSINNSHFKARNILKS